MYVYGIVRGKSLICVYISLCVCGCVCKVRRELWELVLFFLPHLQAIKLWLLGLQAPW